MGSGITLRSVDPADIPTPDAGKATIFVDSTNLDLPSYKDSAGVVDTLGITGATGPAGPAGPVTLGPMGMDGIDGEDAMMIPGPAGPTGASGGGGTSSGTEASLPASGDTGELYLPTDGVYIHRYDGAAWSPWGPIFPLTEPIDGDFAWINQGGASVVTTFGGVFLNGPATAGISWRIRKKAAPATPYTITAGILFSGLLPDIHQFGLMFRASGAGTLHFFGVKSGGIIPPFLVSHKYSSPTVFSASYTEDFYAPSKLVWLRIADNGVSRICSYSPDGQNWLTFHTVGRTDFLTANEVGFAVNAENTTFAVGINLVSWKEA